MDKNASLPSGYSLVDTYLISMLKFLRPMMSRMYVTYLKFTYLFDHETLNKLIEAADDHIVYTSSNEVKGLLRYSRVSNESTIEIGYLLKNSSKCFYEITDVQYGFQRFFFNEKRGENKFFPADLKYPF